MSEQIRARRLLRVFVQLGVFVFLAWQAMFVSVPGLSEDAPILISESTSTQALLSLSRTRG